MLAGEADDYTVDDILAYMVQPPHIVNVGNVAGSWWGNPRDPHDVRIHMYVVWISVRADGQVWPTFQVQ